MTSERMFANMILKFQLTYRYGFIIFIVMLSSNGSVRHLKAEVKSFIILYFRLCYFMEGYRDIMANNNGQSICPTIQKYNIKKEKLL